jgi:hypothetical protein
MSRALVAVAVLVLILVGALLFLLRPKEIAVDAPRAGGESARTEHEAKLEAPAVLEKESPRAPAGAAETKAVESAPAADAKRPLRVRLLESASGLTLPAFRVRVASADPVLESDEGGWITVPDVTPGEAVDLELTENVPGPEDLVQTRKKEWTPVLPGATHAKVEAPAASASGELAPVDLRVACGPTFVLRFDVPRGLSPTDFVLRLRCADSRKAFDRALGRVRAGPLPWARFGACATFLGGGPPWTIELSSDDGYWVGRAELPTLESVRVPPVEIALVACGRLTGRVLTPAREPVRKQWVLVSARGASFDDKDNRPRPVPTDKDGKFDAPRLAPGEYGVKVDADGFEAFEAQVAVAAGATVEREIQLAASTVAKSSLRVRVESATGQYSKPVVVALQALSGGKSPPSGKVKWADEGGRQVGRATLEGVEVRDYHMSLVLDDFFHTSPEAPVLVRPAGQEVACRIDDDVPTIRLRVHQADEASGQPVAGATVEVWSTRGGKPKAFRDAFKDGECVFDDLPVGADLRVRIDAPDHATYWGTERDAIRSADLWTIDARLHEGWGTEVIVRGRDGKPIDGARVFFDGVEAGTSDPDGIVFVSLRAKPSRAEVRYRDWKIGEGSALRTDGTFREWERWLSVVLTPP